MLEPEVSVVIPVCDEELNVEDLAREIEAALAGSAYEVLFIDDGRTDGTSVAALRARRVGAGEPPAARTRHLEIRGVRPPVGRHRRPVRRRLAAAPQGRTARDQRGKSRQRSARA